MIERREVGGSVVGSDATFIVQENAIHYPVEAVSIAQCGRTTEASLVAWPLDEVM